MTLFQRRKKKESSEKLLATMIQEANSPDYDAIQREVSHLQKLLVRAKHFNKTNDKSSTDIVISDKMYKMMLQSVKKIQFLLNTKHLAGASMRADMPLAQNLMRDAVVEDLCD